MLISVLPYTLMLSWSSHHCDVRTGVVLYIHMETVRSDVGVLSGSMYGYPHFDDVSVMIFIYAIYGYPGDDGQQS